METILDLFQDVPKDWWDYYYNRNNNLNNPFTEQTVNHADFILEYFQKAGKESLFETTGIDNNSIYRPNHINSVFFLGILVYYKTDLHKKHKFGTKPPGYQSFPFIWFLTALYHDNAYSYEIDKTKIEELKYINNLEDLIKHFDIRYYLLNTKFKSKCKVLLDSRISYFLYKKKCRNEIDHGLLAGILLYDRLYRLRIKKKESNQNSLFWGKSLIYQYRMAAHAISLHNIWLPQSKKDEVVYEDEDLGNLINLKPVSFKDFPLFYLLAVIDTIEPLKAFKDSNLKDDNYILNNLLIEFSKNSITVKKVENSNLDFSILTNRLKSIEKWLNISFESSEDYYTLTFR